MTRFHSHYTLLGALSKTPALQRVCQKVTSLNEVRDRLHPYLDPALEGRYQVVRWEKGILTLSTESPAWKHYLRFYHMDLLKRLRQEPFFCKLQQIKVIVTPKPSPPPDPYGEALLAPFPLSETSVSYVEDASTHVECPKLKAALARLAKHAVDATQQKGALKAPTKSHPGYVPHAAAHGSHYSPYAGARSFKRAKAVTVSEESEEIKP